MICLLFLSRTILMTLKLSYFELILKRWNIRITLSILNATKPDRKNTGMIVSRSTTPSYDMRKLSYSLSSGACGIQEIRRPYAENVLNTEYACSHPLDNTQQPIIWFKLIVGLQEHHRYVRQYDTHYEYVKCPARQIAFVPYLYYVKYLLFGVLSCLPPLLSSYISICP